MTLFPRLCRNRARLIATAMLLLLMGLNQVQAQSDTALSDSLAADLQKRLKGTKVGDPARYLDLFSPLRTDMAALSPDGKLLAYTVRTDEEIFLHIVDVDQPEVLKTKVLIYKIEGPKTAGRLFEPMPVRWLNWVTPLRVVFATNAMHRNGNYGTGYGEIAAINADGSDVRVLATPLKLAGIALGKISLPEVRVLGLHPNRPESVLVGSAAIALRGEAFRLHGTHALDVLTGELTALSQTMTYRNDLTLADGWGRPRIIVKNDTTRSGADFKQPFLYQSTSQPERPLSLAHVTGLGGFAFSPETVLGERSVPLGFDAKGDVLYYASNVGRDTYGVYAMNLTTKQRLPWSLENRSIDLFSSQLGSFDAPQFYGYQRAQGDLTVLVLRRWIPSPQLVMDRFTHELAGVRYEAVTRTAEWLRPELRGVQDWLAANRPGRSAEILEWNESLDRFLVREQAPADAGAFFVLDRPRAAYTQFVRRGPGPEAGSVAQLTPFAFTLPDGSKIDGVLALPRDAKAKRIPLVLLCPDLPWERRGAEYLPEFEAFTRMGLAVALYNGRGAWGTGIKQRQMLKDDYVGVQVADLVAVADHLAGKFAVSRTSVALFGKGQGGFVALRALQLRPDRFRCAVTVDAVMHGNEFLDAIVQGKHYRRKAWSGDNAVQPSPLTEHPELIRRPVFTVASRRNGIQFHANSRLHAAVRKAAPESELFESPEQTSDTPKVLAQQWARTESFLNYVLYDYTVNLGETEFLPDKPPEPPRH